MSRNSRGPTRDLEKNLRERCRAAAVRATICPMAPGSDREEVDIAIVGAGAAGLATAIFAARAAPKQQIALFDGAKRVGAKILVAGGGRCNVTNAVVTQADYSGGSSTIVRRVLHAFPVSETVAFFRGIGVPLHQEPHGKLFPNSNSGRDVLAALLAEVEHQRIALQTGWRIDQVERNSEGTFQIRTTSAMIHARALVLATGGMSLPKSGSDGGGYRLAQSLGHTLTPTTPALAPLVLEGEFHTHLSGVSLPAELTLLAAAQRPLRLRGDLLWTHFGVSGPVTLDVSRHWLRARLDGIEARLSANFQPGKSFEDVERDWLASAARRPTAGVRATLAAWLPARLAEALVSHCGIPADVTLAHLSREQRRALLHAVIEWPLPVRDSRGYTYAEVTAGGVPLTEIDPATMESRRCKGLYLVGEILDVDGRIGGFNFQWAWSSGFVAGRALASSRST